MGADAINEWMIVYRAYAPADLLAEQANLIRWIKNPYDSQSQGAKSYGRNRSEFRSQLAAIQRVINERQCGNTSIGVADGSAGLWGAFGGGLNGPSGIGPDGSGEIYPNSFN